MARPVVRIWRLYPNLQYNSHLQLLEGRTGRTAARMGGRQRAAPWKAWRGAAWAAAVLVLLAATVLVGLKTYQPTYTSDLTVRQFAENYDYIHGTEGFLSRELYDDGTWERKPAPARSITCRSGSSI